MSNRLRESLQRIAGEVATPPKSSVTLTDAAQAKVLSRLVDEDGTLTINPFGVGDTVRIRDEFQGEGRMGVVLQALDAVGPTVLLVTTSVLVVDKSGQAGIVGLHHAMLEAV